MPDLNNDRNSLSQAPIDIDNLAMLREAKARFSPKARAADREAADEKTREARRAHRAAKRLPAKVANKRARQHRYKLRLAAEREAERAAALADRAAQPVVIDAQALAADAAALLHWLATQGREQGAARTIEKRTPGDLMATRGVVLRARAEGVTLSWKDWADRFEAATGRVWDRLQARRRVILLAKFEGPDGPWQASPETVRVFEASPAVFGSSWPGV